MTFISVTNITNFQPLQAIVGQEVEITAAVQPSNATNRNIVWSIVSGSGTIRQQGTGANARFFLTATGTGTINVRATIANGVAQP